MMHLQYTYIVCTDVYISYNIISVVMTSGSSSASNEKIHEYWHIYIYIYYIGVWPQISVIINLYNDLDM